jgi:D-cysteine desulfhydrase
MSAFESVNWPSRLSLATLPTPLHQLKRLSTSLGGPNIWVKRDDLTGSVLSGNKVRKLEFTLAHAISKGHDLIITCGGLQSNHCRATSFACAQLNIPVHLILRGKSDEIDGNFFLDQLAGASIDCYSKQEYQSNLDSILLTTAEHYRQRGYKPYVIPTGASDGVGVWGYFAAIPELKKDFEEHSIKPEAIVCASGSGGTQAGLTLGADFFDVSAQVIGMAVCDDEEYFLDKVDKDIQEFLSEFGGHINQSINNKPQINVNADYIGDGYGLASNQLLETIKWLAQEEGILLDPVYSGKAFHGLVNEIQKGTFKNVKDIVFVHTGGIFGLFPYKEQFQKQFI